MIMSTRFSNSSMTLVCRFLQKGMRASQAPLQAGWTSMISNLGLRSLQQERKCSASRITVVSSTFFALAAILSYIISLSARHTAPNRPPNIISNIYQINYTLFPLCLRNLDNNMSNVKYLAFCKSSASVPVIGITVDRSIEEALKIEIPKVIVQLKQLQLKRNQRQRIKSEFGLWFCWKDQKDVYYLALCVNTYPERHIYAALTQVQTHLAQLGDYETEPDATLKLHAKEKLNQVAQKYDNLKSVDKIGEANRLLDGIKEDITDSTLKLMNNTVNLEGLQRKASDLKDNAMMFEQSATEVQREMWCRNCKMKILIGVVVVGLICVIVIPIAVTVGKK